MTDAHNKTHLGHIMEQQACDFLKTKGLLFITSNYKCLHGEIDLIMQDRQELVFIEVRFRKHADYGTAIESIDKFKQIKLLKSATHYLQKQHILDKVDCRFDVIGLSNTSIDWVKDAFSYE